MDIYLNQVTLRYSQETKVLNRRFSMTCYDFWKIMFALYFSMVFQRLHVTVANSLLTSGLGPTLSSENAPD